MKPDFRIVKCESGPRAGPAKKKLATFKRSASDPWLRPPHPGPLTPLESEIAMLLARGYRKREIAQMLALRKGVVKQRARSIFEKLGVEDRQELASYVSNYNL